MKTLKLLFITCCLIFATTACEENQDLTTQDSINVLSSQIISTDKDTLYRQVIYWSS